MALACVFHFLLFSHLLPLVSAVHENKNCPSSFDCGYLGKIEFPFTITEQPFCGILAINGCLDQNPNSVKTIKSRGTSFGISHVDKSSIIIKDPHQKYLLRHFNCEAFSNNYTLPTSSSLASFRIKYSETFFKCNQTLNISTPAYFFKYTRCPDYNIFYASSLNNGQGFPSYLAACSIIQLPIHDQSDSKDPFPFLTDEIHIEVGLSDDCSKCHYHEGGRCRVDSKGEFYCAKERNRHTVLIIAAAASAVGCALLMILACCFQRIIFSSVAACVSHLWTKESQTHQIIETFLKEHGPFQAKRYSYVELNKLTNTFKDKLGQGGYGSVYKGRLQDGSLVAVKVLSELKGNGEDFINEVASMSKTSHINIISLLGFCFEGSKRALIYEFMPNGSLEKFIYEEKDPLKLNLQLDCKTLYNIAIGVARGLEYLHGGCNTKILHFDIKPHNILLDEDFHPKISDFGFAKICPKKESVLSLFTARGTAGYIAPEVFSKNFGGVSHKSDVYSFGMMVLEIVGGRHNINIDVDCPSEIYFPRWIYKRFQLNKELGLRCIKIEGDEERVKKMIITSLWCIQTDPINRPTMSEVVEMLEGNLESLQVPPKPFVSSPSTSQPLISAQT